MGLVTKAFTFAPQTLAASAEVNVNFDTLYALVNGNIESDNLAPNAVVADKITDDSVNFNKIDWGTGADQVQGTELTHWRIGQGLANYIDIAVPALTGNRTWTLQDSSDVFVGRDTTDTLTNKTLTSPDINAADIDGGTIDGAAINDSAIGGTTPAAGAFTSLNATGGGSLTGTWSDLGIVSTIDINGGTIDGAAIGGTAPAAGAFTNIKAVALYGVPQVCTKTIVLPEYVQDETDEVPMLSVETSWAPNGIEIIECGIKINAAQVYSVDFQRWTSPTGGAASISTVATDVAETEKSSGAISYTVNAGEIVFADLPSTTGLKWLQVWFVYKVKES